MASANVDMFFDDRNTARQTRGRFRYQDECVALRCVANLVSEDVTAVVVEWSTDYIALLSDGEPELVSVKHRDPGTGDWSMSALGSAVNDLHHVWRAMGERCRCAFVSNTAVATGAVRDFGAKLGRYVEADSDELERFIRVLAFPDPPLPRRTEITAVGVRDMAGALSLLGRDPRHAERCYLALLNRIAAVATEEPDSPEQRIARLTGSLGAVIERGRPRQGERTLSIADLRDLVLSVEAESGRAHDAPRPIRGVASARGRPAPREILVGKERFAPHGPVEGTDAPDLSYREERSGARPIGDDARDLRLVHIEVLRAGAIADRRLAELDDEMRLHRTVPGLPSVVAQDRSGFVTELPSGSALTRVYGAPPYPGIVLDALLRALPTVVPTLEALHADGRAHRALRPEAILASCAGLSLRDAGLAATAPVAGEGPELYRAPEQDRPLLLPPGPATDVFQLAAIVFHMATGRPADVGAPPPSLLRPGLSAELDGPLLSALTGEPARRPSLSALVAELTDVLTRGGSFRC
ncbi:hypothetical protein [Actinoplanes sp. NPDC026623]|uniref:hypothetical protein n=1 Tax=Actinoplanes sp. NPDC026623 TaxID=3155610 RepID=UPI0033EE7AD4